MTKWHAHVAHMAKHMNMVGSPGPTLNPALYLDSCHRENCHPRGIIEREHIPTLISCFFYSAIKVNYFGVVEKLFILMSVSTLCVVLHPWDTWTTAT